MPVQLFDRAMFDTPQAVEEFFTSVLEASTEYAMIGINMDGMIVLWNTGAQRLYGYTPEETIGKMQLVSLLSPDAVLASIPTLMMEQSARDGRAVQNVKCI